MFWGFRLRKQKWNIGYKVPKSLSGPDDADTTHHRLSDRPTVFSLRFVRLVNQSSVVMTIFIQRPHSGRRGHVSLEFQKSCTKVAFDWFNTFVGVNYTFDLCQVPTVFKNEIWWLFALINAVNICVRKDTSDSGIILQRQFTIHFHQIYYRNWHKKCERQRTCNTRFCSKLLHSLGQVENISLTDLASNWGRQKKNRKLGVVTT